ncbi:hypothetical protein G7054_g5573 [Neopestalotiopsis clavispora]|nr:hypothetical protein G7054_g5573 [Neopestalotiopsis clavispora]
MADDGEFITSFDECSPEMIQAIRSYFRLWGEHHMKNPEPLTDAQLEELVDRMVFSTWGSDERVDEPVFKVPQIQDSYVRVGIFTDDLPARKTTATMISEGFEDNQVIGPFKRYYDEHPLRERRAGQPAFMRAKMDSLEEAIVHEFFDKKGAPAPRSYIKFGTGDHRLSDSKRCQAYQAADAAWATVCDTWNSQLCVYLCRKKIQDLSLASARAQEKNFRYYTVENFVRAPNICTKMSTIAACHQRLDILIDKREAQGLIGQAVFQAAVSCEGNAHGNKKSNHIKQEN